MQPEEIQALVNRYLNGTATPEEKQLLDGWYNDGQKDPVEWFADAENEEELLRLEILQEIRNRIGLQSEKPAKRLWLRIAAAASIILALSAGSLLLIQKRQVPQIARDHAPQILPGGNKAILTLANGQQVIISGSQTGKVASQGGVVVNKTMNNKIVYNTNGANSGAQKMAYNTFTTPRGGQFQVVLPDGSHVWLNDESSIRFPLHFAGNERRVVVTGEVYFEVKHDPARPFRVMDNGQTVEVLGTHFNINSYKDEPAIKTTLLQGSIRISKGTQTALLRPGQQAQIPTNFDGSKIKVLRDVDTDDEVAWKDGYFQFDGADLPTIMHQFARWYDVSVEYAGGIPQKEFNGRISRDINLTDALEVLKDLNVDFKVEGKKIIIDNLK